MGAEYEGMNLECSNCHSTPSVKKWNEMVKDAVVLGICDQLIPIELDRDDWEQYAIEHGGRCDCPECGEVSCFEDMTAY